MRTCSYQPDDHAADSTAGRGGWDGVVAGAGSSSGAGGSQAARQTAAGQVRQGRAQTDHRQPRECREEPGHNPSQQRYVL